MSMFAFAVELLPNPSAMDAFLLCGALICCCSVRAQANACRQDVEAHGGIEAFVTGATGDAPLDAEEGDGHQPQPPPQPPPQLSLEQHPPPPHPPPPQ